MVFVCIWSLLQTLKSPLVDLTNENVHTRTLGVRVPCYGCVCMRVRLYIMFVCNVYLCKCVCIYVKTNPVMFDVVRKVVPFCLQCLDAIRPRRELMLLDCVKLLKRLSTYWDVRVVILKVWLVWEREGAAWWIWMYSALLFVYSLYTEILVCIFKDFLCDIRHSELNHNNAQLKPCIILCLSLHTS